MFDPKQPEHSEETVLVLAPLGRDAELAVDVLRRSDIQARICTDLDELTAQLARNRGAILIAEEALAPLAIPRLAQLLRDQPAWSDIPVVVLTSSGTVTQPSRHALEVLAPYGNVTLLDRPIRVVTLTSTMQVALRARRRQYQVRNLLQQREQVLASIRDAFTTLDQDWRYTYVNEQAAQLCGMPAAEMVGKSIWELFPSLIGTELEAQLRTVMRERTSANLEWCNERWDHRWFSIRIYPSEGGLALFTVEVTERKRMEAVVQESKRRLHLALDTSQLGMWYCDLPLDKISWDSNCRRQFGVDAEVEIDFPLFYSLLHPDDREPIREAIERAIRERVNYDVEYRAMRPDGTVRWIHAVGRAFYRESGEPYRFDGVSIDVSDRKKTELDLERARTEAIEANRAKDHFLAALSHELRTPLTPVLMAVAALQQEPDIPDELRSDLEMIHRNVELEARLIDDLLDLTRFTRGKLTLQREVVDLHELLTYAMETCCDEAIHQKQLQVSFHANASAHHTTGDAARLQQVFCNLLSNAVKFTGSGGQIEVTTTNPAREQVEISIRDSGMGIEPEFVPRLFDAFAQGDAAVTRRYGGLGLGLAISKALVELHGGSVSAASAGRDQGSIFTLRLSTAPAPERRDAPRVPTAPAQTGPLRILLTEDHEPTRKTLARLLTRAGHDVETAGTIAEAIDLATDRAFDVLISDIGLPDGSGNDLMRELRGQPGLRGIALSGYGMEEDVKASAAAGFAIHLTKPVDWKRLDAVLATVHNGGTDHSWNSEEAPVTA